jgi:hypothetical protein
LGRVPQSDNVHFHNSQWVVKVFILRPSFSSPIPWLYLTILSATIWHFLPLKTFR